MDRILLDRVVEINQEVIIEGPLLEALRFQGSRTGQIVTLTDAEGKDFRQGAPSFRDEGLASDFDRFSLPTESGAEIILLQALPEKERNGMGHPEDHRLGVSTLISFKSARSISLEERRPSRKRPTGGRRSR